MDIIKKIAYILPLVAPAICLFLICFFPLVICDVSKFDATHFLQYGYYGASGGKTDLNVILGTLYTLGFSSYGLYSGQRRVIEGINQVQGTTSSDTLAVFSILAVVFLILICVYEIFIYIYRKVIKVKRINKMFYEVGTISSILFSLFILIFITVPTFVLLTNIDKNEFSGADFFAYGGMKGILESIFALYFLVINMIRFVDLLEIEPKGKRE
ncbi:MAG: hypothetical protein J6X03_00490 [Bacilli bacterium]|nr:hypothetical protein [Bacilli bacterium]